MTFSKKVLLLIMVIISVTCMLKAQEAGEPAPDIIVEKLTDSIYLLADVTGYGNTGLYVSEDGALIIDAKTMDYASLIESEVAGITDNTIDELIITHWHFDHVGGNKYFGDQGVSIISHENVLNRMSTDQFITMFNMEVPPADEAALPTKTHTGELILERGNEKIVIANPGPGHTDGDSYVRFTNANIIFTGDLYFEGMYPYIGISSGGSIDSMISAGEMLLKQIDKDTVIVPGHGPVSDVKKYKSFIKMLKDVKKNVGKLIKKGKTLEEIVNAKPNKKYDAKLGGGFLNPDHFTTLVYYDLTASE